MTAKIVKLQDAGARISQLRAQGGKKIVFTNGCFDLLHVGHVRYLATARALGDILVVGVNGDQSVRTLKGTGRPLNQEHDRAEVLAALESVDLVTIFPEVRATGAIELVRPDIYVKGGDYTPETLNPEERDILDAVGAQVMIIPFESGYSTSRIIKQMGSPAK